MTHTRIVFLWAVIAVALAVGCSSEAPRDEGVRPEPEKAGEVKKLPVAPPDGEGGAKVNREQEPRRFAEKYDGPLERIAASNILISYSGAEKASDGVTRDIDAARDLVAELYRRIKGGEDFGKLASEYSDGPEKDHEGRIGVFRTDQMLPQISAAAMALKVGEIGEPVESPFGFHIVRRDEVEEVYLAQILVSFKGAKGARPDVERTEEEAAERAALALAEAKKPGAEFAPVAGTYSDHPSKMVGGVMGPAFRGLLPSDLERLAFSLKQKEVGGPVKTDEGYVILKRLEEIHIRHILVTHKAAMRPPEGVTRDQEEARKLIMEAYDKLKAGESFAALALRYSDCPSRVRGGDLGKSARGMMTDKLEDAAFALEVGETSEIVGTEFGFHIIERLPD